jgi:hypothetical protein
MAYQFINENGTTRVRARVVFADDTVHEMEVPVAHDSLDVASIEEAVRAAASVRRDDSDPAIMRIEESL